MATGKSTTTRLQYLVVATLVAAVSLLLIQYSVGIGFDTVRFQESAVHTTQPYIEMPFDRLPNTNVNVQSAYEYYPPLTADSIELFEYHGKQYYQPVNLCHRIFTFIGAYHKTKDTVLLRRARICTDRLVDISHEFEDALYVPYEFRYAVHSDSSLLLVPPFYSGMAQGEFLSVLIRMYEFTGEDKYLTAAKKVFRSLLRLKEEAYPWVVRIDDSGFYWIEEYPHDEHPGMTLNGYIAAAYGVYDYRRVVGDSLSILVYDMVFTTLKHYIPMFRRPGEFSYYCLTHKHIATDSYHRLHVGMFLHLARITGDSFYSHAADSFEADTNQ